MASDLENIAQSLRALGDRRAALGTLNDLKSKVDVLSQQAMSIRVDDVDTRPLVSALEEARARLQKAVSDLREVVSHATTFADGLARSGRSGTGGGSGTSPGTPTTQPQDALAARLDELGLELVPVSAFDFADNPIVSWNHGTPDDHQWAAERWNDTIAPGLASGATRADFEAADAHNNAGDYRRLANVWDMYLGSDAINPEPPGPNGLRGIVDGRHRITTARALGILFLPVRRR